MFRVPQFAEGAAALRRFLDLSIVAVVALALIAALAVSAEAGQKRRSGGHHGFVHGGKGGHAANQPVQWKKAAPKMASGGHRKPMAQPYASPQSSGVMLASGHRTNTIDRNKSNGRIYRVAGGKGYRHHGGHHGYGNRYGTGAAIIVVGTLASAEAVSGGGHDGPAQLSGACAANTYCTVRLGPYSNSPKIITLNTSGVTVEPEVIAAPEPVPAMEEQLSDEELIRRYGSK